MSEGAYPASARLQNSEGTLTSPLSFSAKSVDERFLELLEFPSVREMLVEEVSSPFGAEAALALTPFPTLEEVERALDEVSEARAILAKESPPFSGVFDVRASLRRVKPEGSFLSPQELLELASTLSTASALRAFVARFAPSCPLLQEKASRLVPLEGLVAEIGSALAGGGYVLDGASDSLRLVRQEVVRLREQIQGKFQALLSLPALQPAIAEPIVTLRNERYVIPVRPNYRAFLRGIIQGQSHSGSTFFLEPEGVVELNNRLRKAILREEEEIRKVLLDLTAKVRGKAEEIEATLAALAEVDLVFAKAKFAERLRAGRPKLAREGRLLLLQARHPLLLKMQGLGAGKQGLMGKTSAPTGVVPIDVDIGGDTRALLITGPNMGGKTVALKTVGLLAVMALSGLHIPASPDSQFPFFDGVFADIGDEQSIEQSLSTFSSHMLRIVQILEAAGEASLVLLDELGAGTDPAEGAALGIAVLEGLLSKGAIVLATTHLDAVKAYAASHPRMKNACVLFDLDSLKPLYKLSSGFAGQSYAVEIAARLGLPDPLVQRSRQLLGERGAGIPALLDALRREQERLEAERVALTGEREEAARLKARYAQGLERLKAEAAHLTARASRELNEIVARARKEAERLVAELRLQGGSREAIKEAREGLEVLKTPPSLPSITEEESVGEDQPISPGQWVWVKHLSQKGLVLEGSGPQGMVEVQLPIGRVKLPSQALVLVEGDKRSFQPPPFFAGSKEALSPEITLIGFSSEEAVKAAERYLDDAFLAGLRRVRIIHGKGTGALRKAVEEVLKCHPLVESFHLADFNEGGAGATIVELASRSDN